MVCYIVLKMKQDAVADPEFFKGGDFCKREVTIHCLITKTCELGAYFLYISYMLAQNGG